jgi:membrane-associated phospholipid phosphatase
LTDAHDDIRLTTMTASHELQPWLQLAEHIGTRPWPWWSAALALVLLTTTLAWRFWPRTSPTPRDTQEDTPARTVLWWRLGVGFVLVWLAAALFAEISEEVFEADEELGLLDEAFTRALSSSVSASMLRAFAIVTRLGDAATLVALCVLVAVWLLWLGRRRMAAVWVVCVAGGGLLNIVLKQVFERVRPVHEHGLLVESGYSFPSGHASGAVVAYGMLAYLLVKLLPQRWHLPVLLAAAALAYLIGTSRVFLQVHYLSDVVAGAASGLAWMAVCVISLELPAWRRGRHATTQPR